MLLYSHPDDIHSHRVRIVLAEKAVNVEIINIDPSDPPSDFLEINPYGSLPTLIDRDLVINQSNVIMEYLDERFPHPPLLPVYPINRAKLRLMVHRLETDWYRQVQYIQAGNQVQKARENLELLIRRIIPVVNDYEFFMSEEFSLLDAVLAPLLWRLPKYEIDLESISPAVHKYALRIFKRPAFIESLTRAESLIREDLVDEAY
jgi:RNA polymerase-associated protein